MNWFSRLVDEVLASPAPASRGDASGAVSVSTATGRAEARRALGRSLRQSGLAYGMPVAAGPEEASPERALLRSEVRALARLAVELAGLLGAEAPRREQLLLLFAAHAGLWTGVRSLEAKRAAGAPFPDERTWNWVGRALERRAAFSAGDPGLALVVHNGSLYLDAQVFGRQAIDFFATGRFDVAQSRRRYGFAARCKAALVEKLIGLRRREGAVEPAGRRAVMKQLGQLGLPWTLRWRLRWRARRALDVAPDFSELAAGVRSVDARRFMLEQALLVAWRGGHRSPEESEPIHLLAAALGLAPDALARIELEVAEFYAKSGDRVDAFALSAGLEAMGGQVLESVTRAVQTNYQRLMHEVRSTRELSLALARAARGHKLSAEERARVRAQLIDVAKAIPALAIFAAPGGLFLLIALAKVLPENFLPSAFQRSAERSTLPTRRE